MQQSSEEVLQGFGAAFGAQDSSLERSFEELFIEHYPRLVKTLIRLTGDRGQSEELAAEAFCKLYKQRPPENSAGWVYKAALNLGLDALRANSRRVRREERSGREALRSEQSGGPLEDLLAEEQRRRVRTVIAQLKPVHGQVLLNGEQRIFG